MATKKSKVKIDQKGKNDHRLSQEMNPKAE